MMQQGFTVGPGEAPNSAGPFHNGGLHNTSDDSILTGQVSLASTRVCRRGEGGGGGGGYDDESEEYDDHDDDDYYDND